MYYKGSLNSHTNNVACVEKMWKDIRHEECLTQLQTHNPLTTHRSTPPVLYFLFASYIKVLLILMNRYQVLTIVWNEVKDEIINTQFQLLPDGSPLLSLLNALPYPDVMPSVTITHTSLLRQLTQTFRYVQSETASDMSWSPQKA